ncbi:protein translocase subunit SecF [Chamaesiphon sp. OTE_75_metabat_556]|jgi:preprotein translocase subunit SecF|uniref:protein translocase subunit SecF n=1 Tax=Chamaesiphon sp. OTE_75_metabat_556 TaxID=2964692 RepID=UPI00286AC9F9|nr:protein translocase subunit SecF [Chamaesiphon sp. OTE_75_metabat_556]
MRKFSVTKQRKWWWMLSTAVILAGITSMILSWTNPEIGSPLRRGLDFTGGSKLQYGLDCPTANSCKPIDIAVVREIIKNQGIADPVIQIVGKDMTGISIGTKFLDVEAITKLETALAAKLGDLDPKQRNVYKVGPTLGQELFQNGLIAIVLSFGLILLYLTFRFKFDYAFFAFVALFHDVLITTGIFSILGLVGGVEIDSLFVVALLTIIGFSVNDTVVIYDRIREVISLHPEQSIDTIVDDAVNQTMSRSINTTLTVLLTLISIFLFGGDTLKNFALCLIIGFTAGAYSSIFIASTLFAWWRERHPTPPTNATVNSES